MSERGGNVFLVGPMGSGKTTIGRLVARSLGLEFFDCDSELERRTGATVNLIFDIEGEAGFRDRETRMLAELARRDGVLVATGGGAVLRPENRELLRTHGLVVYLETRVEQQIRRLSRDTSRPLLKAPDRRRRLQKLADERDPLYREVADLTVPSRSQSVRQMAQLVTEAIHEYRGDAPEVSRAAN